MDTSRIRGAASLALGSLAVVALAASPTLAHAAIWTSDTTRHTMLAAELIGADASETADLESMIDLEDANDQVGENQVDNLDANDGEHDQADPSSTDQVDEVDGDNNQDESSTDANDDTSSDGGSSGNGGGGD